VTGSTPAVSRETAAPEPPEAARLLLGERLSAMVAYAGLLASDGVTRGLIGPHEVPRLWERHLLNCAVVADLIPQGACVDDVGSGAGLPGIVLAIHRPDLELVLVEPLLRRCVFLEEAVGVLELSNVAVVRQRAEERARSRPMRDVVTARAVAPLARLAAWSLPLLKPGGVLLALKGSSAGVELGEAQQVIGKLGGVGAEVVSIGGGVVDPATTVVRIFSAAARSGGRSPVRGGSSRS